MLVVVSSVEGSFGSPVVAVVGQEDVLRLMVVVEGGSEAVIVILDSEDVVETSADEVVDDVLDDVESGNGAGGSCVDVEVVLDVDVPEDGVLNPHTLSVRQHFQLRANLSKPIVPLMIQLSAHISRNGRRGTYRLS